VPELLGSELRYGGNGEVANASSRFSAVVVCSIVRDSIAGNPGIERAIVHFRNTAGQVVSCDLFSFNGNGTQVDSDSQESRTGGLNTLSLGPVRGGGNAADGYYTLVCILGAVDSAIISYRVNEADQPAQESFRAEPRVKICSVALDELARQYVETHDQKVKAELEALSRQLAGPKG
jgi:hypothetical protein